MWPWPWILLKRSSWLVNQDFDGLTECNKRVDFTTISCSGLVLCIRAQRGHSLSQCPTAAVGRETSRCVKSGTRLCVHPSLYVVMTHQSFRFSSRDRATYRLRGRRKDTQLLTYTPTHTHPHTRHTCTHLYRYTCTDTHTYTHTQGHTHVWAHFIFAREIGKRSVDANSHTLRREGKPSVHSKCLKY